MYELIVLSLLMQFPAHGYLIAHIINDMIGPYAKISNGRLYPLLAKLEEGRFIAASDAVPPIPAGARPLRGYEITDAGRKRFHQLMMDTTSNPGDYQRIFVQKVQVLRFLTPSERLYLIDHYLNYCQAHVLHRLAEAKDLAEAHYLAPEDARVILDVMAHMADQWRGEVDWALALRARELADQEGIDTAHESVRQVHDQQGKAPRTESRIGKGND